MSKLTRRSTRVASRRHIIIEGCDGTGKDTLIERLTGQLVIDRFPQALPFPVILHERASTSLGGPVAELDQWVMADLSHLSDIDHDRNPDRTRYIYNRHPLISELIYARYRHTNRGLSGKFRDRLWVENTRRHLADYALLVICQPPWEHVHTNLERSRGMHMPGVLENARKIYDEYASLVWPGAVIRYDYTRANADELVPLILHNVEHF